MAVRPNPMSASHPRYPLSLRVALVIFGAAAVALGCGAGHDRLPPPDYSAIREATVGGPEDRYASSRGYAHYMRGMLASNRGDHRTAVEELKLAIVFDPETPHLRVSLAEQFSHLGAADKAEAELRQAIDKAPRFAPAHLALGKLWTEQHRPARAIAELERAVALAPKDPQAYMYLTQVFLETNAEPRAIATIEALGKALPGEPMGFKALGQWFAEKGEVEKAKRYLQAANDRDPGDVEVLTARARLHEAEGQLPEATALFEKALNREPEDPELLLAMGSLYLRKGELPQAKAYFDQLLAVAPEDAAVRAKLAFAHVKANRLKEAAGFFADAQRLSPGDATLAFFLGRVLEELREFPAAADAFAKIGKDAELYPQAVLHQAQCLSLANQHQKAIALLQQGLAEKPNRPDYLLGLSSALERAGKGPDAVKVLEKGLEAAPSPLVYEALAGLYQKTGRLPDAITLLRKGLAARPRDELLLFSLGAAYERQGDFDASMARMKEVLQLNPQNANALNFIGYSYADKGLHLEEAETLIRKAMELAPDNGAYIDSLGWLYFKKGEFVKAVEQLERAVNLLPGEAVVEEHLGDAYLRVARDREAATTYRRALKDLEASPDAAVKDSLERKLRALGKDAAGK